MRGEGGVYGKGGMFVAKGGMACMASGVCVAKGVCVIGGMCGGEGGARAGETATEAGGTHPTGMHSC